MKSTETLSEADIIEAVNYWLKHEHGKTVVGTPRFSANVCGDMFDRPTGTFVSLQVDVETARVSQR